MEFTIPNSLKIEHEELHMHLLKATKENGKVGPAANRVAEILHSHFVKEEEFAAPPLGLLIDLSNGIITQDMKPVLEITDKLKAELPVILQEHQLIKDALQDLISAAWSDSKLEYVDFANKLILHAQTEEEVLYPAAILIGEFLKLKL